MRSPLLFGVAVALLFATSPVWSQAKPAENSAQNLEQARSFFDAGAKAYTAGQYEAAIQAFKQAYAISPRSGILFSMGQAYRRQYAINKQPAALQKAVDSYRKYLEEAPDGNRRADAADALTELEPMLARLMPADGEGAPAMMDEPDVAATRLMVTSPTPGARVSIDGGEKKELVGGQLIVEVAAGQHTFQVSAPGYFQEERQVTVPENTLFPQELALREKPAVLRLTGDTGAEVSVDGRFVGTTPLVRPLELDPGTRFVSITSRGHDPFAEEIEFKRGADETIAVDLDPTGQRITSFVLMGVGAVGIGIGAGLGGVALSQQAAAQDILTKGETEQLTEQDQLDYEDARVTRDEMRRAAAFVAGGGLLVGVIGAGLFIFDNPRVSAPPPRSSDADDDSTEQTPTIAPEDTLEMSAVPMVSPTQVGLSVNVTF